LNSLLGLFGLPSVRMEDVRLPIGISFYTFHALSYIMDIWRGKAVVERNPFRFALYISMFPQLVAGPIIRYSHIARQLVSRTVRTDSFVYGIRRFVIGLGKKLIIADKLAVRADCVFGLQGDYLTTPAAWFGIVCYTLQIYFDFSGYSDMAIGLGRMFGFRFRENFRYPYISQSITEFWRRWHISLSSWFRDYLYIPLGGNRHGAWRTHANLLIVFLLCGLWHGASWNFVVWGIYHGFFLVGERWLGSRTNRRIPGAARTAYAVLVVTVGWVFFRADSISHALDYLAALSRIRGGQGSPFVPGLLLDRGIILVLVAAIIGATPFLRRVASLVRKCRTKLKGHQRIVFEGVSGILGFLFVGAILVYSVMSMAAGTYSPFIYFRF
jgi:alginate O-acetyltransferase complex protein AlgI